MSVMQLQNSFKVKQSKESEDSKIARFEGVITSSSLTTHYNRFAEKSLRKIARQAASGVPVLSEHRQGAQPIGRSETGVYDKETETVLSEFNIQRGLRLRPGFDRGGYADTDSYADALSAGTARNLSIGVRVKDETCDRCETQMRRYSFFGMIFASCENGHYPGQVLYIDDEDKEHSKPGRNRVKFQVTSTINEADLEEFSVVTFPANPDAKVMKELQSALENNELEPHHLDQLNLLYSIQQFDGEFRFMGSIDSLNKGGITMSQGIVEGHVSQELYDGVKSQNVEFQKTIDELNKELSELKGSEQTHTEVSNALTKANARINELEKELNDLQSDKAKVIAYDAECARARDAALAQFNRSRGLQLRPGEEEEEREKLSNIKDLNQIREWEDIHRKNARLKEGGGLHSQPQTPSNYGGGQNYPTNQPHFNATDYL